MRHNFVSSHHIYQANGGRINDPEHPRYNCYIPAESGSWSILDCWPCDKNGNIDPGYSNSPVPVDIKNLGRVVGEVEGA